MKKIFVLLLTVVSAIAVYFAFPPSLPSYSPSRDYLDMEDQLVAQFILAKDSTTIELPEGHFLFSQSLSLDNKTHLTIRGKGMDKTVLSFKGQTTGAEGLKITNSKNIVLEDFTLEDAAGDNLKISETTSITMRRIRSAWTGQVSDENGAYGLYPVLSKNVLIEECEVIGASDAGIYVGQSEEVVIRNNKAYYNVAGIESENSKQVEIYGNEVYENTSGLLIFNLPGLTMYGGNVEAHHNIIRDNNLANFAVKGSIVSAVPLGTGIIVMATKDVALHHNQIHNHKTNNLSVVSYELFALERQNDNSTLSQSAEEQGLRAINIEYKKDLAYNPYPGRISIFDNQFKNEFILPTFSNDFGILWAYKNGFSIPDIAYDGILAPQGEIQDEEHRLCIKDNGDVLFAYLDAAHHFEGFSTDLTPFHCKS